MLKRTKTLLLFLLFLPLLLTTYVTTVSVERVSAQAPPGCYELRDGFYEEVECSTQQQFRVDNGGCYADNSINANCDISPLRSDNPSGVGGQAPPGCYERLPSGFFETVECLPIQQPAVDDGECWVGGIEDEGRGDCSRVGALIDNNPNGVGTNQPEEAGEERNCESEGGSFSFIVCPLLRLLDDGINYIDNQLTSLLFLDDEYYRSEGIEGAWTSFRNIAYFLLIPILLVMVIGTAINSQFVDAYTVRRALPRLFVAVIFIALSYQLLGIMIEVTNAIGRGVGGLIAAPFTDNGISDLTLASSFEPSVGTDVLFTGGVILGGTAILVGAVSLPILASYMFVVFLALMVIFFVLVFRQLLILFLIVLAPLAILAWIFPGNDKTWKLWWGTFWKLLALFPIIIGLLVLGRAFAFLINESGADGVVVTLIKLTAYVGPFFLIPFAFRYVGGAFANLAGLVNQRSKGLFDRQRKYRADERKATMERAKMDNRFRSGPLSGLNSFAQRFALAGDVRKKSGFRNFGQNLATQRRTVEDEELKHIMEDASFVNPSANDSMSGALAQLNVGDTAGLATQVQKTLLARREAGTDTRFAYAPSDTQAQKDAKDAALKREATAVAGNLVSTAKSGRFEQALRQTYDELDSFDGNAEERDLAVRQAMTWKRNYSDHALDRALTLQAMSGGTYFENNEDTWRTATLATHGNDNAMADMAVKGRQALTKAGRQEGLGSFGATFVQGKKILAADALADPTQREAKLREVSMDFENHLLENNPGAIIANYQMKDGYIEKNTIPALKERITRGFKEVSDLELQYEAAPPELKPELDDKIQKAKDGIMKNRALVDNIYQSLSQSKPKIAAIMGEQILDMDLGTQEVEVKDRLGKVIMENGQPKTETRRVTVRSDIDANRHDTNFVKYSKQFVSPEDAEANRAQREMAGRVTNNPEGFGTDGTPGAGREL